jgi:serine/threonine protein kinase
MTAAVATLASGSSHERVGPEKVTAEPFKANTLRHHANEHARRVNDKLFKDSLIPDHSNDFPKFTKAEVRQGKILGIGGFGTVCEVRAFDAGDDAPLQKSHSFRSPRDIVDDDEVSVGDIESRKFIAEHCIRKGGDARYAVKQLSKDILEDPNKYIQGVIDMAVETRILCSLEHPNIIKLRSFGNSTPFHEDYFIVMDRLYDTLEKRITVWQRRQRRIFGCAGKIIDRRGTRRMKLYAERIVAAFDLSAAVAHCHERRIIHRDLKPVNIAFDIVSIGDIVEYNLYILP